MNVNGILADEMGLGKTIDTIALLAYLNLTEKNITHLIIVPKGTIKNWENEIKKWLPSLKLLYFHGDKEERKFLIEEKLKNERFDIILTTYECSMIEQNALNKFNYEYIIIDEAHRLKNDRAKFSMVVRKFNSKHRLLLTGTPLQNDLHELWSLLNFLMPNIFDDSKEFDRVFNLNSANEEDQLKIVKQIHQLLKPFVLRRLKSDVDLKLPPKKEIYLYVGLSSLQKKMYKQILSRNIDMVNGINKDRFQLHNILMQLRKVCNHPYLFPNVEEGPPYIEGEHLIYNSMKLKILDILLKKIHSETNDKVLIFSQMTLLLNILDDYCRYRGFKYLRMDGQTSSEDRDKRIEEFQNKNSDKWIFLISTRAGGLGINLHAANIVILYDSDWNPQVDLQAIDRAHRIGQTKDVTIYRFVCEGTVEEKIVQRAAKKLKIDHLIIQKGKSVQNKVSALEMTNILQYGADKIFSDKENDNQINEEKSIEQILEYSINKTESINNHLKSIEEKLNINNLSLNNNQKDIYEFEGEDYKKKNENQSSFIKISDAIGERVHKKIYDNLNVNKKKYVKSKHLTGWKLKAGGGYVHQFFDVEKLDYLDEKENKWNEYLKLKENQENNNENEKEIEEIESIPEEFTKKDEDYRNELINKGFTKWTKKDFQKFLSAAETNGLDDPEIISKFVRTKTKEEVENYIKAFKKHINDLPNGERIIAKINKNDAEKKKNIEFQNIVEDYFESLFNFYQTGSLMDKVEIPYKDYKIKNNQSLNKDNFTEEEDKYLLCLMFKYGYKNWNSIKFHILLDPLMKFDINLKMKNENELNDRANYIIMCLKNHKKKEMEKNLNKSKKNNKKENSSNKKKNYSRSKSKKKIKGKKKKNK